MGSRIDITGERYGNLVAISPTGKKTNSGGYIWLFKCDCGKEKALPSNSVRSGLVKSCGCMLKRHGMTGTRLFRIWVDMKQRCTNKNYPQYYLWGGKGITVCNEWLHDFVSFHKWATSSGYKDNLTIDRINTNGNYEPSNCRWVTPKEQARNTSQNCKITIDGETKLLCEWIDISPITRSTYYKRKAKGMSDKEALFTQSTSRNKRVKKGGD